MDYPVLTSGCAGFVAFNCDVTPTRVLAGAVAHSTALPEFLDLYSLSGQKICEIAVPNQTRISKTPGVISSQTDNINYTVRTLYED